MPVPVTRLPLQLNPDPKRVISRLFCPGDVKRSREIFARVEAFLEEDVEELLAGLEQIFADSTFPDLLGVFAEHYEAIRARSGLLRPAAGAATAPGRLLHDGLRPRVGRTIQPFDRPHGLCRTTFRRAPFGF